MKLTAYFDAFLRDTVNLNQTRLDLLQSRVESIVVEFGTDDEVGAMLVDYIPQGSWAHRTIIRPIAGREFDADFLLSMSERRDWSADPKSYVNEVAAAFRRSTRYKDMVEIKTRCVRIVYADDCHVDVVPYLVREDGSQVIVNRTANMFEATNPEGFSAWMTEKDDLANANLRKVIRLAKYLRDYKATFGCPSVILTTLLGEQLRPLDADVRYADVPTALKNAIADLDGWLQIHPTKPSIEDPSCPGTNFDQRWEEATYTNFRTQIGRYNTAISAAYDEPDRDASLVAWQKVFGPDFKAPATATATMAVPTVRSPTLAAGRAPREELITDRFALDARYRATIIGRVLPKAGFRHGPIRNLGHLQKQRELRFSVRTDAPSPYDVYWKVRNFGNEAERADALRGELMLAANATSDHRETTLYVGEHYIECYVVKDGHVVATDRHRVFIR